MSTFDSEDGVDKFLTELGSKSGTTYNRVRSDRKGKGTKVILSGKRKCQHAVRRHSLKNSTKHSGPGRQLGIERVPGKILVVQQR